MTVAPERDPSRSCLLDLVVSVGGDGTFLRGAHVAAELDCPVLGVKVGRLGFLTEVEPDEALDLIRDALAGGAAIEERLARRPLGAGGARVRAAVGAERGHGREARPAPSGPSAVEVDGEYVTTFSADGVDGRHAHRLHRVLVLGSRADREPGRRPCSVLTPVAAHMVFDRSFVLGADQQVVLEVVGDEPGLLSADGRESVELPVGSARASGAAERPARLVRRAGAHRRSSRGSATSSSCRAIRTDASDRRWASRCRHRRIGCAVLRELHISGLGVIDDLDLELHAGLNVLTGETGAGKTMVTVGLALALGARAGSSLVRDGAAAARVQARFDAPDGADEWSEDGEVLLARSVSADGKSAAKRRWAARHRFNIGGARLPPSSRSMGSTKRSACSRPRPRRASSIASAETRTSCRLASYREAWERWRDARAALEALAEASRERERELDLLAYQVREIEGVGPGEHETDQLVAEEARLAHVERLLERVLGRRGDALG